MIKKSLKSILTLFLLPQKNEDKQKDVSSQDDLKIGELVYG